MRFWLRGILLLTLITVAALHAQDTITFERVGLSVLGAGCTATNLPLTPNVSSGVVVFTLAVACGSQTLSGTARFTFPTGRLTGTNGSDPRGETVFTLTSPLSADFSLTLDVSSPNNR